MKIKCIQPPEWARPARITNDGLSAEALARLHAAHATILSTVHAEVSAYLSDPALAFESADEFPSLQRLNGDYYVGDTYCAPSPEPGYCRVSVMARCLAHPLPGQTAPDDYLGLEVWLESSPDCTTFAPFRNTDSSAL